MAGFGLDDSNQNLSLRVGMVEPVLGGVEDRGKCSAARGDRWNFVAGVVHQDRLLQLQPCIDPELLVDTSR